MAQSRKDDLTTPGLDRLFARFVVGMLVVAFSLLAVVSTASASYSDERSGTAIVTKVNK